MWPRRDKFPPGPYGGLKGWSFGPLNENPLEFFCGLARDYGDVAGIRVVNFRSIFINHPSAIEEVLVGHPRRYVKGRFTARVSPPMPKPWCNTRNACLKPGAPGKSATFIRR